MIENYASLMPAWIAWIYIFGGTSGLIALSLIGCFIIEKLQKRRIDNPPEMAVLPKKFWKDNPEGVIVRNCTFTKGNE